ncbi:MAG: hypothetical protein ACK47B_22215 [Armatimonadota bacterium]
MSTEAPLAIIADDNLMFAMMAEPALKRCGYRTRTLSGGPGSAARIAAEAPELVLVNLASTRYPGADLIRDLRAEPATAETPVIGYAGHVERDLLQAGRDAGATLVVPNSAISRALPEVLEKLQRRLAGEPVSEED